MFVQSHAISSVAVAASLVWKRICRIGIRAANEKMLRNVEDGRQDIEYHRQYQVFLVWRHESP